MGEEEAYGNFLIRNSGKLERGGFNRIGPIQRLPDETLESCKSCLFSGELFSTDLKLVRFPTRSPLTLATLPSMSLVPFAPFTDLRRFSKRGFFFYRQRHRQSAKDPLPVAAGQMYVIKYGRKYISMRSLPGVRFEC